MSAFDSIVACKPRENAGPLAANRFDYQLNWGLQELLSLEESGLPYTIIFDYHDDILVLDSDESPNYIDFYQVKTNTSAEGWTKSKLTELPKKKELVDNNKQMELFDESEEDGSYDGKYSKIAKLLIHSLDFPKEARDFFFVTNANFGRTLIPGKLNREKRISFSDLIEKTKEEIKQKIKEELPDVDDSVFEHLHFIKNQMNVDDYEKTIIGYLNEFLEKHLPKAKVGVKPVYETLMGEIRKRNNYETIPNSVDDLVQNKAFTKAQFHQFLKGIETLENIESKETKIREYLQYLPEKASAQRRNIIRKLQKIREETLIYDNHEFLRLYNRIEVLLSETEGEQNEWEWSQKVLGRLHDEFSFIRSYDDDFLTCLILYEI